MLDTDSSDYTPANISPATGIIVHKCMYYTQRLESHTLTQPALNARRWPTGEQSHLPRSLP